MTTSFYAVFIATITCVSPGYAELKAHAPRELPAARMGFGSRARASRPPEPPRRGRDEERSLLGTAGGGRRLHPRSGA